MAVNLPAAIVAEKNKVAGTGTWVELLEIQFPDSEPTIYLANNNEDLTYDSQTWERFQFYVDDVVEDGRGGLPSFMIKVNNVDRRFALLVDKYAGALGATATLRVVHFNSSLVATDVAFEEPYKIISASVNLQIATFTLGAENPLNQRSPRQRYLMDSCRFKVFKGTLCGHVGGETTCDRTLKQCTNYGNDDRFGGFPSISVGGGFYA